ncbi:hypothetical protein DASC09_028040 [Saccharomycopsis crataegensis]|uniref:Uncharacterized protein n=1 Tax=Saccharomycopsis crataegensis TaxID=43959 RepID=A0AAV5QLH6_9ASCO|nr:hypothetical protein DASC09_028040 [Saccharomycopsis crataegensis]
MSTINKKEIKPATTWRLEKVKQRALLAQQKKQQQQQQQQQQENSANNNTKYHHNHHHQYQGSLSSQHSDTPVDIIDNPHTRESTHSLGRLIPASSSTTAGLLSDDLTKTRHESTYSAYSDASDRFSFDQRSNSRIELQQISPASSTSNNSNIKTSDLRVEPLLPRNASVSK